MTAFPQTSSTPNNPTSTPVFTPAPPTQTPVNNIPPTPIPRRVTPPPEYPTYLPPTGETSTDQIDLRLPISGGGLILAGITLKALVGRRRIKF
jgi:hypothetical protein